MIKYSLQNECLENIEAFTDEQISREMAVIESVLEIYNKTILMMELSNSDVDLPDCSMFMESTFFQESDGAATGNGQTSEGGQSAPATTPSATGGEAGQQSTQNNTQSDGKDKSGETKKPMTEEERKAYNKEHWVRMKNKKGNLENIFISIIAFIPRLLGFIIQSIVRFFKKLTNKENDDDIKNAQKDAETLTEEEIIKAEKEAEAETPTPDEGGSNGSQPQDQQPQPQPPQQLPVQSGNDNQNPPTPQQNASPNGSDNAGSMDPKTKMWTWFDEQRILEAINRITNVLSSLNIENIDSVQAFNTAIKKTKGELDAAMSARVAVDGNLLVDSKKNILRQLNSLSDAAKRTKSTLENFSKNRNLVSKAVGNGTIVNETKDVVNSLKEYVKAFNRSSKKLMNAYDKAVKRAKKIRAKAAKKRGGPQQDQQPQSQQPVNTEGGENNGGQDQNNQPNT